MEHHLGWEKKKEVALNKKVKQTQKLRQRLKLRFIKI